MELINTRLLSHPMNWVTILLMLVIAGIFGHLLLSLLEQEPASKNNIPASLSTNQTGGGQPSQFINGFDLT